MVRSSPGPDLLLQEDDYFPDFVQEENIIPRFYKVPIDQGRVNPEAYTPHLFSLGPYHSVALALHPPPALYDGDRFKEMAAEALLEIDGLQNLINKLEEHEPEFRTQYVQMSDARLDLHPRVLPRLLALDAVTIIASTLPQRIKTCLIYPIARIVLSDAILLENQIPIIVLRCALESLKPITRKPTLAEVLFWYCKRASPFPEKVLIALIERTIERYMREPLLAWLYDNVTGNVSTDHVIYVPETHHPSLDTASRRPSMKGNRPESHGVSLPTASQLARCGVRFGSQTNHAANGIHFNNEEVVLSLPRVLVSDTTVRTLHNLLAYEATAKHPHQYCLISYVHFMDRLIDTADDVRVLVEAGVIHNELGSHKEVASTWNKLCTSVSWRNTKQHNQIMAQLQEAARVQWYRWRTSFKEVYWEKKPWLIISIVAAITIIVLSLLQTIFTIRR